MVLVNDPGSPHVYSQLDHATWNGRTFTDTIFPFFIWIAGGSLHVLDGKTNRAWR